MSGCQFPFPLSLTVFRVPWDLAVTGPSPLPLSKDSHPPALFVTDDPASAATEVTRLIKLCVPRTNR